MTYEQAEDAATRMEDVGYATTIVERDGHFEVDHVDNSGFVGTCRDEHDVREALDYMESEGDLIARGLPGRY